MSRYRHDSFGSFCWRFSGTGQRGTGLFSDSDAEMLPPSALVHTHQTFLKMLVVRRCFDMYTKSTIFHCSHWNLGCGCVAWKEICWCETNLKWIGAKIWSLFISLVIIGNAVIDMVCLHWPLRVRQLAEGVGEAYLSQTVAVLSSLSLCQHKVSSNFSPWLCLH